MKIIDDILLWFFLILGVSLFIFALRKPPIKDWLIAFLISAYSASIIGIIVESEHLIEYPTTFLKQAFPSSVLFEFVLFPVINTYFYQSTYRSSVLSIVIQGVLYTSVLTIGEVIIRKHTSLIAYTNWNWVLTFVTVLGFLIGVRFLLKLINRFSYLRAR